MHRRLKAVNAPLEAQENENRVTEEKQEASCSAFSKGLKLCKVTKSKVLKASKKENLSAGKEAQLQKCTQKYIKGLEKESGHGKDDAASCQFPDCCFDMLKGDGVGDQALPLSSKENLSSSRPVSLGDGCYLTPNTDKAEENSACGVSEKQRKTPLDFAPLTIADLGMTPGGFTKPSIGKSPTLLKLRRRSAIGVRGSPENNSLIRFLAQQRSKRQQAAFPEQVSPFQHVKSLKDKTDAFPTPFESLQEAEGELGSSGLSQVDDASQEGSYFSSDHITEETGSDVLSGLSRKLVGSGEELSLAMLNRSKTPVRGPVAPPPRGEGAQSGSYLPSALRKTPVKQVMESIKEYSNDAVDRGEGESLPVSSCAAEILEGLEAENTAKPSSEKPKKKRVTFGEVLSPEIFDKTLPANTPLRRGATPGQQPAVQSGSPMASPPAEPLSQPSFDSDDECVEPPQELVVGAGAAEDLFPAASAEAETDKPEQIKTPSAKRKQSSTSSEGADLTISRAPHTENAKDTNTPRKNKGQRQRNTTTSAAKKTQKTKYPSYGKRRRKKKVKKSLYGEREMASKKPLLSPIPEMPEVLSSSSTPNSPKENTLLSEAIPSGNAHQDVLQKLVLQKMRRRSICVVARSAGCKDLGTAEASSSQGAVPQVAGGELESVSGIHHKFSTIVPDAKCALDTSDSFQQGKETAFLQKGEGDGSWLENEQLEGDLHSKAEQLLGLELLDQQDRSVHEGAQRIQCPEGDSVRGDPPRRKSRRSSAIYFPPVEKLELTGDNLPVSSFNVEEVLSAPQLQHDSLEPFRSKSGERRVRRSMRLLKGAETEGLAWVQVPPETQKKPPLLASAPRSRRTISTPFLTESEYGHQRQPNLLQFAAPGKEKVDSVPLADGPPKRWRRRSLCVSTPQETRAWAPTCRRSMPNSVYKKDRGNQEHYEEVEIPLDNI